MTDALGSDLLSKVGQDAGISAQDSAKQLAQQLPDFVDTVSPPAAPSTRRPSTPP
ncbi:YidB family protein [Streptomyces nojiriensis]|uniref:YidB family protein n=1 Tax=Streptomyces nojiriensis TaxID=66374 RepID=UPI0035DB189B